MTRITKLALAVAAAAVILAAATRAGMEALPPSLNSVGGGAEPQLLDRNGTPLTITYQNAWNVHNRRPLYAIPPFLQQAFILAEDKRFAEHNGIDWRARLSALGQNLMAGRVVRGASTISEQAVRMLHPRPRTFWTRWLEGWEAEALEQRFSKADILEFYLNQVPYAAQRRGVVEAADYWFDRDLETLNRKEMLALAVLVRAPGYLDPRRRPEALEAAIERLLARAVRDGALAESGAAAVRKETLALSPAPTQGNAKAAVAAIMEMAGQGAERSAPQLHTTLDAQIQATAERILRERLAALEKHHVYNGALLLVDHQSDEVLAWVNVSQGEGRRSQWYDAVTQPRQPGSALKPLLYALALERGWTAATLIDDTPLSEMVVGGLHSYRNYSRSYYGPVRLRDALGNSLNIPAVRAIQHVGTAEFLAHLKKFGINSLRQHPDYYGDGLALGNGEVTLWELVGAYAALARGGLNRPLKLLAGQASAPGATRAISPETAGIIGDILSDPEARRLEFGAGGLMKFPVETAIKTGTSSDYRDAWAVAFSARYTAGVWMGNLSGRPMNNITGARGPVLVLRSLFAELARRSPTRPLPRSPLLNKVRICLEDGRRADGECPSRDELFVAGTEPGAEPLIPAAINPELRLRRPHNGLRLAMDPRIPDMDEAFPFRLDNLPAGSHVVWYVDGQAVARGTTAEYLWPMSKGEHTASAEVTTPGKGVRRVPAVSFFVK